MQSGSTKSADATPERFLGYTVARLAAVMQARMDAALVREIGLGVRQFGVLALLAENPGMGSGELARRVLVKPQSMGPLVDKLAARGLLQRAQAGPGRTRSIALTERGLAVLQRGYAVADWLALEEQAGLTPAEIDDLNRKLLRILARLQPARDSRRGG